MSDHRVMDRAWELFGTPGEPGHPRTYGPEDLRLAIAELEFERANLTDFELSVLRSFKAELGVLAAGATPNNETETSP